MADQIAVRDGNGTPERVAYDLYQWLRQKLDDEPTLEQELALFARCLRTVKGL